MTIGWINPVALAALAAAAGPIVVHLLRRQRARRVPFPTLQFLVASRAAAARFSRLSDPVLLALRVAIVAAAAVAAAQPIVITGARRAAWEQQPGRALVIDTSESMATAASRVGEAVAAERQRPGDAFEIRTPDVSEGLKQASSALRASSAARGEVVVISDFQQGSLTATDVAALPADVGLRLVAIEATAPGGSFAGWRAFSADGPAREPQMTLDGPRTRVTVSEIALPARDLVVLARPEARHAVVSMQRAVAAAGAPDLPSDRGVVLIFAGVPLPAVESPRTPWMLETIVAMRSDERLRAAAVGVRQETAPTLAPGWVHVARTASGRPLVAVAAMKQKLAAYVSAAPGDYFAAAALRALLCAIAPPLPWTEREVERISTSQLSAWTRPPGPASAERWKRRAPGDARWCWAVVLLLLGVETLVRRTRSEMREAGVRAA